MITRGDDAERSDEKERRMIISVNSARLEVDDQMTVAALLESLGYPDRGIAVALDQTVLPRSGWTTTLSEGSQLDVMTAVQGG
jgi:sulfur carrier protein